LLTGAVWRPVHGDDLHTTMETRTFLEFKMSTAAFVFGDRVRHTRRPEWGVGTIVKCEELGVNGQRSQRLSVRFPNGGMKTLLSDHAELERVTNNGDPYADNDHAMVSDWDKMHESEWLTSVAARKVKESMITLPMEVRDPFNSLAKRLELMMGLYRFDRSGRGLMDWAVAQTGLNDPLSRFTRHELEQHFDRWAFEREQHLSKLLQEARMEQAVVNNAVKNAPPAAQSAVRKLTTPR
jgi:hypothetical protein